ncbi:MAG: helix-turn-helix domain-containing protein [Deltaproteobacteria bacterium]|nr:helix-turn-helix domain-containing protein [Deltaproteobacteria bacterium]
MDVFVISKSKFLNSLTSIGVYMEIKRAYKTELDPNNKQRTIFWRYIYDN